MSQRATDMIRADHRKVDGLYQRYTGLDGQKSAKRALVGQICQELEIHAKLEEGIFYPAVQAKLKEDGTDLVSEALERIAWTNTTGARNAGVVTFHRLAPNKTRIMLQVSYEPEGVVENVGAMLGVVSARVRGDLQRFKKFIEARGTETGAWRGAVEQPQK